MSKTKNLTATESMTPQQLLAKGIAENNMDLIKEANTLLQSQISFKEIAAKNSAALNEMFQKKRGRPKKVVDNVKGKNTRPKTPKKKKATSTDDNFLEQMFKIEEERHKQMLQGGVGGMMNPKPIALDDKNFFTEEHKEDLKLGKKTRKKQPRRPSLRMVEKNCPRCGRLKKMTSAEAANYSFDSSDTNSQLPLYTCGCLV